MSDHGRAVEALYWLFNDSDHVRQIADTCRRLVGNKDPSRLDEVADLLDAAVRSASYLDMRLRDARDAVKALAVAQRAP